MERWSVFLAAVPRSVKYATLRYGGAYQTGRLLGPFSDRGGGTDGEQLAEVLLDREEELRTKDIEIQNLTLQFQAAALEGEAFEADRSEYEVRPRFQGDGPVCKRRVPVNND